MNETAIHISNPDAAGFLFMIFIHDLRWTGPPRRDTAALSHLRIKHQGILGQYIQPIRTYGAGIV